MYKIYRLATFFPVLIIFFGLPIDGIAQDDFLEGYVVTNTNDTLYGLVKDRKTGAFGRLYKKIKFKGKRGNSRYAPKEIKSYKRGDALFETMSLVKTGLFFEDEYEVSANGVFQFLKVAQRGYLSHYLMEYEDSDSGYIDAIGFFKKSDEHTLVRVSQGIFGLKRKKLAVLLSDCPELVDRINGKRIKQPEEIVRFYNHWKSQSLR